MKKLKSPKGLFTKFLIWAYHPGKNIQRIGGRSPLDIPGETVFISFVLAVFIALLIGNIFIPGLHYFIDKDLTRIEVDENGEHTLLNVVDSTRSMAIVDLLLPHEKRRLIDAEAEIRDVLKKSFKEDKITINAIAEFIGMEEQKSKLRKLVIGELERNLCTLYAIPFFEPKSPDDIADEFGLYKSYSEEVDEMDTQTWKRLIFISAVQYLRDKLDAGISHPRRLLTALGGGIQWITFIIAIWCLFLLLVLRTPWSKLQLYLVVQYYLPWHSNSNNVWDLKTEYFNDIDEDPNYPEMFIPSRLIKDVKNIFNSTGTISVYNAVRERVEAFRNSVEVGEYEIVNFLIWATPTFGFIGTIFGIISAMENAAAIFSAATQVEQAIALDRVSVALGTAFDTSFIALIWLVPMSYFLARTRKAEANLFEELEFEGIGNLPPQIEES